MQAFSCLSYFLTILVFASACNSAQDNVHASSSPFEVSREEKVWMEKFFRDLLFEELGAFTLWGSKPITEIVLYTSEAEMATSYENLTENEDCYISEKYDLPKNWEKWEKISSRFPMKRYLLFKSHTSEDENASFVYFVDVLKTAALMQDHYDLFRKAVGFDFHPLEVVLEMPNPHSRFWKKMARAKDRSLLWGLLFGYGKINSYTFHWKYFDCPESCSSYAEALPNKFSNPSPKGRVHISAENFTIPPFVSFEKDDEMIQRYQKERDEIKAVYKGKDFLDLTLRKLSTN